MQVLEKPAAKTPLQLAQDALKNAQDALKKAKQIPSHIHTVRGEYVDKNDNHHPTLTIKKNDDPKEFMPFSFGIGKARLILAVIPDIQAFVRDMDKASN